MEAYLNRIILELVVYSIFMSIPSNVMSTQLIRERMAFILLLGSVINDRLREGRKKGRSGHRSKD